MILLLQPPQVLGLYVYTTAPGNVLLLKQFYCTRNLKGHLKYTHTYTVTNFGKVSICLHATHALFIKWFYQAFSWRHHKHLRTSCTREGKMPNLQIFNNYYSLFLWKHNTKIRDEKIRNEVLIPRKTEANTKEIVMKQDFNMWNIHVWSTWLYTNGHKNERGRKFFRGIFEGDDMISNCITMHNPLKTIWG